MPISLRSIEWRSGDDISSRPESQGVVDWVYGFLGENDEFAYTLEEIGQEYEQEAYPESIYHEAVETVWDEDDILRAPLKLRPMLDVLLEGLRRYRAVENLEKIYPALRKAEARALISVALEELQTQRLVDARIIEASEAEQRAYYSISNAEYQSRDAPPKNPYHRDE